MHPLASCRSIAVTILAGLVAGCAKPHEEGPRLTVAVAPLALPGLSKVCYDLAVRNGANGGGELVWARGTPGVSGPSGDPGAICSNAYGTGAGGAITFVGTCDADAQEDPSDLPGERTNSVTLWVDGLFDTAGTFLAPDGPDGWQDPCPSGCTLHTLCEENADARLEFSLAILRQANQGFFDIGVTFDDIFCSAKVDCVGDGGEALKLLFNPATGLRDTTVVTAFACTSARGATIETDLFRDPLTITCGSSVTYLDPAVGDGNAYTAANPDPDMADPIWQYAIYAKGENASCGGFPCKKHYWNVAFGLDAQVDNCVLTTRMTGAKEGTFAGFNSPPQSVYPVIDVNVPLTSAAGLICTKDPLNGLNSGVQTIYTKTEEIETFSFAFGDEVFSGGCSPACSRHGTCGDENVCICVTGWTGATCATPICKNTCQNGGTCSAPDTCQCAPGWTGPTCQTPVCNPACEHGQCTAPDTCTCDTGWSGVACETLGPGLCMPGKACDDGDPATWDDFCDANHVCSGKPVTCPAGTPCTDWVPNGTQACVASHLGPVVSCNDANPTTHTDTCNGAGSCVGTTVECPANTACATYLPAGTTTCQATYAATTTACSDGDASTTGDFCNGSGTCVGTPSTCPANNACNDGNPATYNDRCNDTGLCAGVTIVCPTNSTCTSYVPNGTSACAAVYAPTSAACNDNDATTVGDFCNGAGSCLGTPPACVAGTVCNDGNNATTDDRCSPNGTCIGVAVSCPAATTCVSYTMDGTSTCTPVYASATTACNDGNASTSGDFCNGAGVCAGTAANCVPNTSCNDGNVATYADRCTSGACVGTAVSCPANTACTSYAPNGTSSCTATWASAATSCDDGDAATTGDFCNGFGTCVGTPATCAPNSTCNDGNAQTYADRCNYSGTCVGTPVICPTSTACVTWTADGSATCKATYATSTTTCNDGDVGTYSDRCNGSGSCVGSTVTCPANTACTTYTRNGTSSCTTTYAAASTSCNDGNASTHTDVCNGAGQCSGQAFACPASTACASYTPTGTGTCNAVPATAGTSCAGGGTCDGDGACVPPPVLGAWANLSVTTCGTAPSVRNGTSEVEIDGKLYIFSGHSGSAYLSDLHAYEYATGCWTNLTTPLAGTIPVSRYLHSAVALDGKMYVFGGHYNGSNRNDLHVYDPVAKRWTDLSSPLLGSPPSARYLHSAFVAYGKMYVFGGNTGSFQRDLYTYDPVMRMWSTITTTGSAPTDRMSASAVVISGKAYFFGGYNGGGLNHLYALDLATNVWTNLSTPLSGTAPSARWNHVGLGLNGRMLIFGGTNGSTQLGDFHAYDPATRAWTPQPATIDGVAIGSRQLHAAAVVGDTAYVFAGSRDPTYLNELLRYTGASATPDSSTAAPSAVTYDSPWRFTRDVTIPFKAPTVTGGTPVVYSATGLPTGLRIAADSGVIYGTPTTVGGPADAVITASNKRGTVSTAVSIEVIAPSWVDRSTVTCGTAPSVRVSPTEVTIGSKIYLFGGWGGGNYKNDLYSYEPATGCWEDLSTGQTGTPPSIRYYHGATALDGKLYIFGGYNGGPLGELFVYDPVAKSWSNVTTPLFGSAPSARYGTSLWSAYGKVYIYGGYTNSYRTEVFTYDPISRTWATVTTTGSGPSMGYKSSAVVMNGKAYIFGGTNGSDTNALYSLDLVTHAWTNLSTPLSGTAPTARTSHSASVVNGKMVIFGGRVGTSPVSDIHTYNPVTRAWVNVSNTVDGAPTLLNGTWLAPRYDHGAAAVDGVIHVFGGSTTNSHGNVIASPVAFTLFEVPTTFASSAAPASISYAAPWIFTQSITIAVKPPTVTGGAPTTYTATNLPAGLRIAPDTGVIYGTPTAVSPSTGYTITASNELGSVSTTVDITVLAPVWTDRSTACGTAPPARYGHTQVAINGKVYVFGGSYAGSARNELYAFDVDTGCWTNLSTPASGSVPGARMEHSAVALDGKMYVYGGVNSSRISDIWAYDPVARTWANISTPLFGALPDARNGASIWAAYGKIYIFGGYTTSYRTEVFTYDPTTRTWATLSTTGTGPSAGYFSSAAVINGKAYIFGGTNGSYTNQLFSLDLVTLAWTNLSSPLVGTAPSSRHTQTASVIGGKMYIFGGHNGAPLSDIHAYDPTTRTWVNVSAIAEGSPTVISAAPLGTRAQHAAAVVDGLMYVFGGYGAAGSGTPLASLMTFKPYEANTAPLTATAAPATLSYSAPWLFTKSITIDYKAPTVTGGAATLYTAPSLPPGLKIAPDTGVIYGTPTTVSAAASYTITATNALGSVSTPVVITVLAPNWTDLSTTTCGTAPTARYHHTAVTIDRKIYVFGGVAAGVHRNELHAWDKDTGCWTNLSTPASGTAPGVRAYHTAVALDGKMYVFGGHNGGSYLGDLHAYDPVAQSWTNLSSPLFGSAPAIRHVHMSFVAYGKVWIYGGHNGNTLGDLHHYDPTTRGWTQITTTGTVPTARYGSYVVVIDGVAYVFGGYTSGYINHLYALDLVSLAWTNLSSPLVGTAPSSRHYGSASVLDGKMVIFGGNNGSTSLADVHSYDPKTQTWLNFGNIPEGSSTVMNAAPLVGRAGHTGNVIDGAIHVFGGYFGGSSANALAQLTAFKPSYLPPVTPPVVTAPTAISYASPWLFTQSIAIAVKAPTVTGGTPTLYSAASLPPGLRIAPDTGVIYGTPTTPSAATDYDITASNAAGTVTTKVNITVLVPNWTDFSTGTCGTAPTPRYYHTAVTIDRKLYVFGGSSQGSVRNDLYAWDKDTGCWTNLSTPLAGSVPTVRYAHTATVIDGKMYIFGGHTGSGLLNDLHVYDPVARSWTNLSWPLFGSAPGARYHHATFAAYGKVWIYGGNNNGNFSDLHFYDPTTRAWTQLTATGAAQTGRYGASFSVIDGIAYMFGGYTSGPTNTLWALDLATLAWTTVTPSVGSVPSVRYFQTASSLDGKMYIFGGYDGSTALADVHSFDPKTKTWLNFGNIPEGSSRVMNAAQLVARTAHTATVIDGAIHVFGGYYGNTGNNALAHLAAFKPSYLPPVTPPAVTAPTGITYASPWIFTKSIAIATKAPTVTGGTPTLYSAASLPPGLAIAPDTGVLYGTPTTPSAATDYTITATNAAGTVTTTVNITVLVPNWTDFSTGTCGTAPTARYHHTSVTIDRKLYIFGGSSQGSIRNDLYEWDKDTGCWTNLSSPAAGTVPTVRYAHTATVIDGKMYIFGGHTGSSYLNDLHVYDPASRTWTNLSYPLFGSAPSSRLYHMAFAAYGKLWIYGGNTGSRVADLHTYDPTTKAWTQITTTNPPSARESASVVVMDGVAYFFGGYTTGVVNALYALDLVTLAWTTVTPLVGTAPSVRYLHTASILDGKMYIFGGHNGSNAVADSHSFDPKTRTWLDFAAVPEGSSSVMNAAQLVARAIHSASVIDGAIYVFGGYYGNTGANALAHLAAFKPSYLPPTTPPAVTAPTGITYASPWIFTKSIAIATKAPTVTGGSPTLYSAASLPPGLAIAPDTGVLYGTPTTPSAATDYTITASNAAGTVTTTVNITVLVPNWTDFSTGTCGTAPTARYHHTSVTIDRKLYIFGGTSQGSQRNELYSWDKDTGCWTNLSTPLAGTVPSVRYAHTATVIDGKMYIFGGHTGSSYLNDLHVYDPAARTWTNLSYPLFGSAPSARLYHMAFGAYGKLWIYGGNISSRVGDLHTYDPTTKTWSQLTTTNTPSARESASVVVMDGVAYFFGGYTTGVVNALHALDLMTLAWTTVTPLVGTAPSARYLHTASILDGKFYVFGGSNGSYALADMHAFDPKTKTWVDFGTVPEGSSSVMNAAQLVARTAHTASVIDGAIHFFGGYYGSNSSNALALLAAFKPYWPPAAPATFTAPTGLSYASPWIFTKSIAIAAKAPTVTGGTPTLYAAASLPPGLAIAPDTGVIYGTPTTPSAATNYDITASNAAGSVTTTVNITVLVPNWTDLSATTCGTVPSVRYRHTSVAIGRKVYIYGGISPGTNRNDLHAWDMDTGCWTDLSTPLSGTAPGHRQGHTAVALDGKMYVFGGYHTGYFNDLHVYDPQARSWTNLSTPLFGAAPSGRYLHRAFAAYGKMYVFGGHNGNNLNDLHTYDPTTRTWAQLTTTGTTPTARYNMSIEVINGVAYLYGGYSTYYHSDLQALDLVTLAWTAVTPLVGTAPTGRREHSASVIDGKMYIFGGNNGSSLAQVHSFDPKTRTWLDFANLPEGSPLVMSAAPLLGRTAHTASVIDGTILVFGGYYGSDSSNMLANLAAYKPYLPPATPTPSTAAPATLSYASPWLFTRGVGIALKAPTVTGGAPTSYSAAELPAGLFIAPDTGVIYGTPTLTWPSKTFTITASNELGSVSTTVDITVLEPSWTDLSTPLCGSVPAARHGHATVAIDGRIYVFGGSSVSGNLNDLVAYDVDTACWINLSPPTSGTAPTGRNWPAAAALNGKLYIFGGYNGAYLNDLHVYDPVAQSWTNLTATSTGTAPVARIAASMAAANGKLYLVGGESSGYRNDIFTYTPSGNAGAWATVTPTGTGTLPAGAYRSMVLMGDKLYVFGGVGSSYTRDLHSFDLTTQAWTSLTATVTGSAPPVRAYHTAVVLRGEMYVFGGRTSSNSMSDLYSFDPVAAEWTNLANLPEGAPTVLTGAPMSGRDSHGAAEVDGVMYVFGGQNNSTRIQSLLAYLPYW
jgi:N-acetylneuraminic acid mutarotase